MSRKYTISSSYLPRDTSSREPVQSKFSVGNSKFGTSTFDRRSGLSSAFSGDLKLNRNLVESVEHSPVWAKTNPLESSSSVQRLKEHYNLRDGKKSDLKDSVNSKPSKFYGRSYTTLHLDDRSLPDESSNYSKFRKKLDSPCLGEKTESENVPASSRFGSNLRNIDTSKNVYISSGFSRLPARRYTNDLNSAIPSAQSPEDRTSPMREKSEGDEIVVTVVTRGTSPTPTTSTVYLRSKRIDYGIEKRIRRPRKKPEMVHKEIQTEKEEISFSKYACYGDSGPRSRPWSSYADKYSPTNSYGSKYSSGRPGYDADSRRDPFILLRNRSPSEYRRSVSGGDEPENPTSPESPLKSPAGKPPFFKEPDKKLYARKSPPSNPRLSLKIDCANKADSMKTPTSPGHPASPLQSKMAAGEILKSPCKTAGGQSPKVTIERCPDIMQAIADASSASESSEDESSSDNSEDESNSPALTIKKSITNFLQNIPNSPTQRGQIKVADLFHKGNSPSQKINFRRIESGEKAWWLESSDKIPDGTAKVKNTLSVPGQNSDFSGSKPNNNFLTPISANGVFTRLNSSSEPCPREDKPKTSGEDFGEVHLNNGYAKGDQPVHFHNTHSPVNSFPIENVSNSSMKFNLQGSKGITDGPRYLGDFSRDSSAKDINQKLTNGLLSPTEDKNHSDSGITSGLVAKMRGELTKAKLDIRKSSSRELSPVAVDPKSEIDLYWKELAESINRPLFLCDLDFTDLNTDDESDIFGHTKMNGEIPAPPPMLILPGPATAALRPSGIPAPPAATANQPPLRNFKIPPPPVVPQIVKNKKTVKLFWKEVKEDPIFSVKTNKNNEGGQIWDELLKVTLDTQKLEYLFESRAKDLASKRQQDQYKNKEVIVLDPKRSNAINIGMTKLPPPRAIKTAILKMDATVINKEGIEKVLTMLPTEEEKVRIAEARQANPDVPLGSAEQFLLTLAAISQLEARLRLWAFKLDFENSEREICEPLMDLKQGMEILRVNKTFRAILSTLLSMGNFLNGYDVKGFQIEYLSKVPEVKDTVHKHSLLHHLCIIVMEKFPESTDLYSEIGAVTRASKVDFDELGANIKKLEEDCKLSWNYLKMIAKHEGHTTMKVRMSDFLADCAERIIVLNVVHKRIISRFHKFAHWLGTPVNRISTTRPNEIFKIISEFALEFRTTRDRVLQQIKKINREKNRSRGYLCADGNDFKMNSKEAKDDAKLKQLLGKETTYGENMNVPAWRRHRKDTKNILQETNQNEAEILETLIKTANQKSGFKERRRSRAYGKSCEYRCKFMRTYRPNYF